MQDNINKITRNSIFFSDSDYEFESDIGLDYISQDMGQSVILYAVDRNKSLTTNIYGEAIDEKSISYKEPVELNVVLEIDKAVNKTYDKSQNLGVYSQIGNLTFHVYLKTLKQKNVDIIYGDYVGVQLDSDKMEYFVVTNDGRTDFDNAHTMYGTKQFYRTITCTPTDKNEFLAL